MRKNKTRSLLAMLLVLVMAVSLLAACGKKQDTPASDEKQGTDQNSQNSEDKNSDETEKQDTEGDVQGEAAGNEQTEDGTEGETGGESADGMILPLTDEKKELSIWLRWSNSYVNDPNELIAYQELENRTNVHINWNYVGDNEAKEKFGLLVASGEYPDIVCGGSSYYTGGLAAAVDDGVFLDMTDIVEQYMPNYYRILHSDDEIRKNSSADGGRLNTVWAYATLDGTIQGESIWAGLALRRDWLEELNKEVPETIDEWHDVLVAFKENMGCDYPMSIPMDGSGFTGGFLSAYDVMPEFYQVDGKVKFGPLEEGYKQ